MGNVILECPVQKIKKFNEIGFHYNLVADQVHRKHSALKSPFDESFLRYIIAGLISFDMGRGGMMGDKPYEMKGDHFASRLSSKLKVLKPLLKPLMNATLTQISLQEHRDVIARSYNTLSVGREDGGKDALHEKGKKFHVGATKILHFLNPNLFIIVDSNAARAFQLAHNMPFRNTTQPGYSAEKYMRCMEYAQADILAYGLDKFKALEPDVPITRIYDKLTFVTGHDLGQK